jgi:hypothetical protein
MATKGRLAVAAFVLATASIFMTMGGTEAANVKLTNRLAVDCTLEAPNLSIPMKAKSTQDATIDDAVGDNLTAVCKKSGLDKDQAKCKLLTGGPGGSGQIADKAYPFKYVNEIHVFAQIGQWLVCSSI